MKARRIFLVLLIAAGASAFAQSRSDVRIYLPLIVADDPEQAEFFRKNFTMEITAAGYTVTESIQEADYTMRLSVRRNVNINDNGTSSPAPPGEPQYLLQINLMRNSDTVQIVTLSYGFTELEEMYNHNLSLVYQTLANVPLGSGDGKTLVKYMVGRGDEVEDWWRNKWLYFRLSADYPINYYQIKPDGLHDESFIFEGDDPESTGQYSRVDPKTVAMPGLTVGLEAQFLYWMSLEVNFALQLWDVAGFAFIPGVGAQLKFPLKPTSYLMLEPYAAGIMAFNTEDHSVAFPRFSVGGGAQLGVKGAGDGIFFFDVNFMYSLGEAVNRNLDDHFTRPETLHWDRFVIGLSAGFKVGLFNRGPKAEDRSTWLFKN